MGEGLALCRRYFEECALPEWRTRRALDGSPLLGHLAVGLAGEGSDCFGFDDLHSRDHDWGPAFAVWYDPQDRALSESELRALYAALPRTFEGASRTQTPEAAGRVGVVARQAFFRRLIGREGAPETPRQWLAIPEQALAAATNGAVFWDGPGDFSALRGALRRYPPEVRLKKLAARMVSMGQAGQYNFERSRRRGALAAMRASAEDFARGLQSFAHLFSGRYCPFYKWAQRSMRELPDWARSAELLERLAALPLGEPGPEREMGEIMERLSREVLERLRAEGFALPAAVDFLPEAAAYVQAEIRNDFLRGLPLALG